MKLLPTFLTIIAVICFSSLNAQLINIESKRMHTDSVRFALKNDNTFKYTNNNGRSIYSMSNSLTTQLKSVDLKKILLLSGSYHLIRSGDQDFANIWLLHLRFNYKLSNIFRLESFVQSQRDEVLDVSSRNLFGIGIRLKLISMKNLNLYLGNSYMYEVEKSNKFDTEDYYHRNSTYLSITASIPNTKFGIVNTFYFQPLYNNLEDYRFLEQFRLNYKINKWLSFFGRINYYVDNITPGLEDEKQYSSQIQFGLGFAL